MRAALYFGVGGAALLLLIAGCAQPSTREGARQGTSQGTSEQTGERNMISAPYQGLRFDDKLNAVKARLAAEMIAPISVPVPRDAGGGYTHEKHKDNAKLIYEAGAIYELTGETVYAEFARDILMAYADVYPAWGLHPARKEQSPGRMFWQNLNESWWLVHAAQGYDAVKSVLSEDERAHIETHLLRNMADFLSHGSPETFDRIHNHGTWANAAVGITGYAIGDKSYSDKALMGLDGTGKAGFIKQLDVLFSPDGYYNEGPYYQRYALMPFVLFGQAIAANEPEKEIFKYRDGILEKAIYATIQQSYNGYFFPINDSLKDKGLSTTELLHGVSIAYDLTGDTGLLSIAQAQSDFVLTPEAKALSDALVVGKKTPFEFRSMRLSDGAAGDEGALDILRDTTDPKGFVAVMKNTSQGLGHGHFDKLGLLAFDKGHEILRDYGAARFLNIEAKYGGHYLPENNLYAKQSIAHNVLVIDETSHFGGDTDTGNQFAPALGPFVDTQALKLSSAQIVEAYPDVELSRTLAIVTDPALSAPILIDVSSAKSSNVHLYDQPFHYNGQLIETNLDVAAYPNSRAPLGEKNGYQFLWKTAQAPAKDGQSQITFLQDKRFYTVTSFVPKGTSVIFAETGATDPNFNLRREPAFILRSKQSGGVDYVSVIEPHGEYNPTAEYTLGSHSQIKSVNYYVESESAFVRVTTKSGAHFGLGLSRDATKDKAHTLTVDGKRISWTGPHRVISSEEFGN